MFLYAEYQCIEAKKLVESRSKVVAINRADYSDLIDDFLHRSKNEIVGALTLNPKFDVTAAQVGAWERQVSIMQAALAPYRGRGKVYFEYKIPRLGGRIDVVALIDGVIFVIEFKVGADTFTQSAVDQVCDYALDLKNFHETSHEQTIAPIVVATEAENCSLVVSTTPQEDRLLFTIRANAETLAEAIAMTLQFVGDEDMSPDVWEQGRYSPTPTIIEAAKALYAGHSVQEISRSDASAKNLRETSVTVAEIIQFAQRESRKCICFVTGVPGAGKTLVGLNVATKYQEPEDDLHSVFLSGNGPLVNILQEALARDKVKSEKEKGEKLKIGVARQKVKAFIQNVHHFRDDCIRDSENPPFEHVALFDEAQRAWNLPHTKRFMKSSKGIENFNHSEPKYLISCLDRHDDWAVIVCLVGGGQEINSGEAGITEWLVAVQNHFPEWRVYVSPELRDNEYNAAQSISELKECAEVIERKSLHLSVSMRSFRAEHVSSLVAQILDMEVSAAKETLQSISNQYPIVLTRNLKIAKQWLRDNARGSERYGIMASSRARRLRPHAIDPKPDINPINWFLAGKDDVRSSYYLEDVATEFKIQGLEIDWGCLTWDADFRHTPEGWNHWSFKNGKSWNRVRKPDLQNYQKNAYRVLLTRARQGMVIVVPEGDPDDPTRACSYYDPTFEYLKRIGFATI